MDERLTPSGKGEVDTGNSARAVDGEDIDGDQGRKQETSQRLEVDDVERGDPGATEEKHRYGTARRVFCLQRVGDVEDGEQRRGDRGDLPPLAAWRVHGQYRDRGSRAESGDVYRPLCQPREGYVESGGAGPPVANDELDAA